MQQQNNARVGGRSQVARHWRYKNGQITVNGPPLAIFSSQQQVGFTVNPTSATVSYSTSHTVTTTTRLSARHKLTWTDERQSEQRR
jgi:hypothetical protein